MTICSSTTDNARIRTIIIGHPMPKKLNITAKIAPDVLLQEFKSEEFYFFDLKISLFRKCVSYLKININISKSLINKGIIKHLLNLSHYKSSNFNRCFRWRKRWDSNPRALADYLISSQARYDHFDTLPYLQ